MEYLEYLAAAAFILLIYFFIWLLTFVPVISIRNSLKRAVRDLDKNYKLNGDISFLSDDRFVLFRRGKLRKTWQSYLETSSVHGPSDISSFFGPESLAREVINVPLFDLMPFVFFVTGTLAAAGAYYFRQYTGTSGPDDLMISAGISAICLITAMLIAISSKVLVHRTKSRMTSFVRWMNKHYCGFPDFRTQLEGIAASLQDSIRKDFELISELKEGLNASLTGIMQPFLDDTTETINDFVLAATDKQIISMDNMAARHSESMEKIYGQQIERISSETSNMAQVQSEVTILLKEAALSSSKASRSVEDITSLIHDMTAGYAANLAKLQDMHMTLASSVDEFKELAGFIRLNYTGTDDKIVSLAASQKEILDVSLRANDSLRAAADDMLKAGEALRSSYGGISKDLSADVDKVFASFDENLSKISLHLSRSIQDLQEAVDELPEILRRASRDV